MRAIGWRKVFGLQKVNMRGGILEYWNIGMLECWKGGRVEGWKGGTHLVMYLNV